MDILTITTIGIAVIIYSIASVVTFGRVKTILSYDSPSKINYNKWAVDIAIALLLAIFLPIPFIIFHETIEDYRCIKGIDLTIKKPEFDDIAWQEVDTSSLNKMWPVIERAMANNWRKLG